MIRQRANDQVNTISKQMVSHLDSVRATVCYRSRHSFLDTTQMENSLSGRIKFSD